MELVASRSAFQGMYMKQVKNLTVNSLFKIIKLFTISICDYSLHRSEMNERKVTKNEWEEDMNILSL